MYHSECPGLVSVNHRGGAPIRATLVVRAPVDDVARVAPAGDEGKLQNWAHARR